MSNADSESSVEPDGRVAVRFEPAERRLVAAVSSIALLRMFGLFMLLPVLALWASGLGGSTPTLIGIAVGGYGVTQALLQLPFGALSDRVGRKPVIVGGLAVFVFGSALAAGAETIGELIAGRVLQGAGAVSSTLTALLGDRTRPQVRLRATAVLGVSIGAGFLLALIGGPLIASLLTVGAMFWLAAGCGLAAIALTLTLPGERHNAPVRTPETGPWLTPTLARLDFAIAVLHLVLTALFVVVPFVLRDVTGVAPERHWLFHVGAIVGSLVIAVPLILRAERSRPGRLPLLAMSLVAGGFALMAVGAAELPLIFAGALLFFAGFNVLEAGLPAWVSLAIGRSRRGAALGLFASAQFFGAFLGGLLGGALLAQALPALQAFSLLAAIAIAAAALLATLDIGRSDQ